MPNGVRPVLRDRARRDIESAVDWYRDDAGLDTALAFVDAVESAFHRIARHPEIGSPRYATELGLPGLRSYLLEGFPHLVFYVERPDHLDVWRVLHAHRDLPPSLTPDS